MQVRHFSRDSWETTDDVDLDSVAYGFMASQVELCTPKRYSSTRGQALFSGLEIGVFDKALRWLEREVPSFYANTPPEQLLKLQTSLEKNGKRH